MAKKLQNIHSDFERIHFLIREARNRVYAKANNELVLLYYNVGKFVSEKVNAGSWGENTVLQLADFIHSKEPSLTGFNRRGLYRMKQFYEVYSGKEMVSSAMSRNISPAIVADYETKLINKKILANKLQQPAEALNKYNEQ